LVIQEFFHLDYLGKPIDAINRHTIQGLNVENISEGRIKYLNFNGTSSKIEISGEPSDFSLGSNPNPLGVSPTVWTHASDNNNFTIDCWVKPEFGKDAYYPICSSFSKHWWPIGEGGDYNIGWSLQVDCSTGKIQFINISMGHVAILESTKTIVNNVWSHVAVMSWSVYDRYSEKFFYINGVCDAGIYKSNFHGVLQNQIKKLTNWSNCWGYLSFAFSSTSYGQKIESGRVKDSVAVYDFVTKDFVTSEYSKVVPSNITSLSNLGIVIKQEGILSNYDLSGSILETGRVSSSSWRWIPGSPLYIDYQTGCLTSTQQIRGPVLESVALALSPTMIWFYPRWQQGNFEKTEVTRVSGPLKGILKPYEVVYTYSGSSGRFVPIRNYESSHPINKIGIVTDAEGIGSEEQLVGDILLSGLIEKSTWNLTPNKLVYLNSSGFLTNEKPTISVGVPIKSVGSTISKTQIWFSYGWNTTVIGIAETSLSLGDVVYKISNNWKFKKVDSYFNAETIGMVTNLTGINKDNTGEITLGGNVTNPSWTWKPGKSIFYDITAQELTQTKIHHHHYILVGSAYTSNSIWFSSSWKEDEYANMYIGVGPKSLYFDSFLSYQEDLNIDHGYHFSGSLRNLRVCLGPRFSVEGHPFDPLTLDYTIPRPPTTSTTVSTTTATTTVVRPIDAIPFDSSSEDLFSARLQNYVFDFSHRHPLVVIGSSVYKSINGVYSFYFNGSSYIKTIDNLKDFCLGSTLTPHVFEDDSFALGDNVFTIDFWIYPEYSPNNRYSGICSSFGSRFFPFIEGVSSNTYVPQFPSEQTEYKLGWALQIDSLSGKLQMIGYSNGSCNQQILESSFVIPDRTWSHIAIMSWKEPGIYPKRFYLMGVPDTVYNPISHQYSDPGSPFVDSSMYWCNGVHRFSVGDEGNHAPSDCYSYFYLGASPKSHFTHPLDSSDQYFNIHTPNNLTGCIRNFRISLIPRFNVRGFQPPLDNISTTSTTSTQTTTSTSTTTISTLTFTTTVSPLVKLYGIPVASSSMYDGRPEFAFDGIDSTSWKPMTPEGSWVGISFVETSTTTTVSTSSSSTTIIP
jgi:hypothetical protein